MGLSLFSTPLKSLVKVFVDLVPRLFLCERQQAEDLPGVSGGAGGSSAPPAQLLGRVPEVNGSPPVHERALFWELSLTQPLLPAW